uniref:Arf-GAP with Rho-GAP domain, ANK repeat and PH domain-containing protein 1-like n=1 Tax=Oncorhynchus kisutch TaxID=8019 RepID=A0A8C7G6Z8_ONCKI
MSEAEGCVSVWEWLCALHLDQYFPVFQDAGFGTLLECQGLTQDQLETIGIKLPGHRKRILVSLQKTHHHTHPEREHDALLTHLAAEGDQREEERAVFRPSPLRRETPLPAQRPRHWTVARLPPIPTLPSALPPPIPTLPPTLPPPILLPKTPPYPPSPLAAPQTAPHYASPPPPLNTPPWHPNPDINITIHSPLQTLRPQYPSLASLPIPPQYPSLASPPIPPQYLSLTSPPIPPQYPSLASPPIPPQYPLPSLSTNPLTVPLPSLSTNPLTVPLPSLSTNPPTVPLPSLSTNPPTVPLPSLSTNTPTVPLPSLSTNPPTRSYESWCVVLQEVYSKRIIPTAAITGVTNVGEQKFEVVTTNRTFLFRAESDFERNEWVSVLQNFTRGCQEGSKEITSSVPHSSMTPGSPLTPEQQGYLELRGLRSKLYTVVSGDKVFLYKNMEDYRLGIGITSIDMNVGNVKDTDRRSFDLTTPYRIFSFLADSEQHKDQWVEAMREAIGEALSNSEVANKIWAEPSNGCCADCGAAKPEWAAINLCVVVCKRCAGEHRGLGPSISKVRSLKMDRRVWTEELIQVFLLLGNERLNRFWAANVPPSEALSPTSCSEDRRRFVSSKYRQGKYRKYHPLYGNQEELNNADCPSPLSLALAHNQKLQAQFLSHNLNTVPSPSPSIQSLPLVPSPSPSIQVPSPSPLHPFPKSLHPVPSPSPSIQSLPLAPSPSPSIQSDIEGIYRKSGVNSRVAALCEAFRRDARSVRLKEGEHQVDDVSNHTERFFRESGEGLFTILAASAWLSTPEESRKICQYQLLLSQLPRVNKATLRALVNHLYCVQRFAELNQMNLHNLAIVFGPTLFQSDGKDYTAGLVVEELIEHYTDVFEVDELQLKRQLDEITAIIKASGSAGDFICTVYLEEKKETTEQHVKIPGSMTAAELTCEILDRRKIQVRDKDYWSCWEVSQKEETERPLHHLERVLPIIHSLGTDSHLLVKKHLAMEAIRIYLASKVDVSKHGMVKFREERSILGLGLNTGSFHDRYFILSTASLRMYKEVRSNRPEREWQVKNLRVYLGIKKKLRPPTWYLCCDTQTEMREWFSTFLTIQYDGNVWPADAVQTRVTRALPADTRHGNVALIPLRGSENEMRNSVAAFTADPLGVSQSSNHRGQSTVVGLSETSMLTQPLQALS